MKFLKQFSLLHLFFVFFISSPLIGYTEEIAYQMRLRETQNFENVVEWAQKNLSKEGVLLENREGFVYLKVDDNYINELFPLLQIHHYVKPSYFRRPDSPGAHISVFYRDERHQTGQISEIGQRYTFELSSIDIVPPKHQEYVVLKVHSQDLENLRVKYGLQPLLKGHDFHITIAKKIKNKD